MADQSMRFLIDANSDQAIAQIKKAVQAVFGLGNATLTVNREASEAYRQTQAAASALAGAASAAGARLAGANRGATTSFDELRASLDQSFAGAQRFRDIQIQVAAAVERGEASQQAANIVLEQAAKKYMGTATAAERAAASAREAAQAAEALRVSQETAANATAAAAARVRAAYEGQRAALDPLFASSQRYQQVVTSVSAALEAQVIDQAEANRVLAMAEQRYMAADRAGAAFAGQARAVVGGTGQMGTQVQNAAFQIGDFAVQVAGGTSAMRAASMQLPQLLGGFGLWGAVIGGAVAVLGALIPMLFQTGEKAEEAGKRVDQFTTALGDYASYTKTAMTDTAALRAEFGRFAEETRQNAAYMAQVSLGEAKAALKTNAADMIASLDQVALAQRNAAEAAKFYFDTKKNVDQGLGSSADVQAALENYVVMKDLVTEAAKAMGTTVEQASRLRAAMGGVDLGGSVNDLEKSSQAVLDVFQEMFAAGQALPAPLVETYKQMNAIHDAAVLAVNAGNEFKGAADAAAESAGLLSEMLWIGVKAAIGLSDAAPKEGWLSGAISDAITLGGKLVEAGQKAINARLAAQWVESNQPGGTKYLAAQYAQYGAGQSEMFVAQRDADPLYNPPAVPKATSGSSGGGGSSPLADLEREGQGALQAMELAVKAVNEKVRAGLMTTAEGVDAVAEAKDKAANSLAELIPQMEAIGTPQAVKFASDWREAIGDMADGLSEAGRKLSDQLSGNFESAFASVISGAASGKQAFQSFAQSVLNDLAKIAAQRFTAKFISPIFDTMLSGFGFAKGGIPLSAGPATAFARGGVPSAPGIEAFANGGVPLPPLKAYGNQVVASPTFFAMGGGRTGVMGEAGSEAIMPLSRGRDGKLGVVAQGAGGAPVTVNIINQAGAQVTQTTRNENGGSVVDVVISTVKGAMVDDITRGGDLSDALSNSFGLNRRGY